MRLYIQSTQSHPQPVGLNYSMCIVTLLWIDAVFQCLFQPNMPSHALLLYSSCGTTRCYTYCRFLFYICVWARVGVGVCGWLLWCSWTWGAACDSVGMCLAKKKLITSVKHRVEFHISWGTELASFAVSLFFFMRSFLREKAPSLGLCTLHYTGCGWQKI